MLDRPPVLPQLSSHTQGSRSFEKGLWLQQRRWRLHLRHRLPGGKGVSKVREEGGAAVLGRSVPKAGVGGWGVGEVAKVNTWCPGGRPSATCVSWEA